MSKNPASFNLLFGAIAIQLRFVSQDQFAAAIHAWITNKEQRIDQILWDQGAIDDESRRAIMELVRQHLKRHEGNADKSLQAVLETTGDKLLETLNPIQDADIQSTLVSMSATMSLGDSQATVEVDARLDASEGDRFRIVRPHAKGGLGQIFVAQDVQLNREVALKEMLPHVISDENSRSRFLLEAEVTGRLEHPGIVPVYGLGVRENGCPFYAMRFVKGETFKEAVDRFHTERKSSKSGDGRGLELRALLGRLIDVCNAIEYSHSRGILHRDLKPSNIMLGRYGETLVVDWGLAKPIGRSDVEDTQAEITLRPQSGSSVSATIHGQAMGTPAFMPPEQAAGRLSEIGPASDVYGIGATLYYLLTGASPFDERDVSRVLQLVQKGEFAKPRQVDGRIDKRLESICLRAMSRVPIDRYNSPLELSSDLERWMADEPVTAHREVFLERSQRVLRRNRSWSIAGTAALILVTLVSVASLIIVDRARSTEAAQKTLATNKAQEASRNAARALEAEGRAQQAAIDARREQVATLVTNAFRFLEEGFDERALVSLMAAYRNSADDPDEAARNRQRMLSMLRQYPLVNTWDDLRGVVVDPQGERFAGYDIDGNVLVFDFDDGELLMGPFEHTSELLSLDFGNSGDTLASSCRDGVVRVWNLRTGELDRELQLDDPAGTIWLLDSEDEILALTANHTLSQFRLDSDNRTELASKIDGWLLDHNDDFLLFSSFDGSPFVMELATGRQVTIEDVRSDSAYITCGAISPDGSTIALGLAFHDLVPPAPVPEGDVPPAPVPDCGWPLPSEQDGQAIVQDGDSPAVYDVASLYETRVYHIQDGWQIGPTFYTQHEAIDLDFTEDGEELVTLTGPYDWSMGTESGRMSGWSVETGELLFETVIFHGGFRSLNIDPSGRRIMTTMTLNGDLTAAVLWTRNNDEAPIGSLESGGTMGSWNVVRQTPPWWHELSDADIQFNRFGTRCLVSASDPTGTGARLWDLEFLHNQSAIIPNSTADSPFAFTPDGDLYYDIPMRAIDPKTRRPVRPDPDVHWETRVVQTFVPIVEQRTRTITDIDDFGQLRQLTTVYTVAQFYVEAREIIRLSFQSSESPIFDAEDDSYRETLNTLPEPSGNSRCVGHSEDWGFILLENVDELSTRIWDVQNQTPVGAVMRHWAPVQNCTFHSNNEVLVSTTINNQVQIWDVETGTALSPPIECEFTISKVEISDDLRFLAIASELGIHLVDLHTDADLPIDEIEARVRLATLHEMDSTGAVVPIEPTVREPPPISPFGPDGAFPEAPVPEPGVDSTDSRMSRSQSDTT